VGHLWYSFFVDTLARQRPQRARVPARDSQFGPAARSYWPYAKLSAFLIAALQIKGITPQTSSRRNFAPGSPYSLHELFDY
jgi:hypothetical protein